MDHEKVFDSTELRELCGDAYDQDEEIVSMLNDMIQEIHTNICTIQEKVGKLDDNMDEIRNCIHQLKGISYFDRLRETAISLHHSLHEYMESEGERRGERKKEILERVEALGKRMDEIEKWKWSVCLKKE